jgi:hypothetical protein
MTGTSRITTWRATRDGKLKGMTPESDEAHKGSQPD